MATPENLGDEAFESLDELEDLDETDSDLGDELDEADSDDDLPDDDSSDKSKSEGEEDEESETLEDESADEEEESLDVILAREQDLEEEFATVGEGSSRQSSGATPAGEDEFTCRSCFLVKRRARLADVDELICADCV